MILFRAILILMLSSVVIRLSAYPGPPRFAHLSLNEGVSNNLVYAMAQDHHGFMWFGTLYGLVRYDGYRYEVFQHDPQDPASISFDDIISLKADTDGHLWVGTWEGGLNRLDLSTGKFSRFFHDRGDSASLIDNSVYAIAETGQGVSRELWFATHRGLSRLRPNGTARESFRTVPAAHLPSTVVQSLLTDSRGTLWIGTARGLTRFRDGQFQKIPLAETPQILDLAETPSGHLLAATARHGLLDLGPVENLSGAAAPLFAGQLPAAGIAAIAIDKEGSLWLGTPRGLVRIRNFEKSPAPAELFRHDPDAPGSLSSDHANQLLVDNTGILWVGSYYGGVDYYAPEIHKFGAFSTGNGRRTTLPGGQIRALAQDRDGAVLVGTERGLAVFPAGFPESESPPASTILLAGQPVSALYPDPHGEGKQIWAGTAGNGVYRITLSGKGPPRTEPLWGDQPVIPPHISALAGGKNAGELWVGTAQGIYRLDVSAKAPHLTGRFLHSPEDSTSLPHSWVTTLYRDSRNRLWAGTYGGLARLDSSEAHWQPFISREEDRTSLSHNYVYAICEDPAGTLWVATAKGLNRLSDDEKTFTCPPETRQLSNQVIVAIANRPDGTLWLATQKGISRYQPQTGKVDNFDSGDGLLSNISLPGALLVTHREMLLAGTVKGLNFISPEPIPANRHLPAVHLTGISLSGQPLISPLSALLAGSLELDYHRTFLRVDYAVLDYRQPGRARSRFRLAGLDSSWHSAAGNGSAVFSHLPPGEYRLEIQGANGDGLWNPRATVLPVVVRPPFWETAWFRIGMLLVLFGGGWLWHRHRLRRHLAMQRRLAEARSQERALVREATAQDYHDTVGHQIARIGLYGALMRRLLGAGAVPAAYPLEQEPPGESLANYLSKIVAAAEGVSGDTRDFLWTLKPGNDSAGHLQDYLLDFAEDFFEDSPIHFSSQELSPALRSLPLSMDCRRQIILIFKEAMTNILRHSQAEFVSLAFSGEGQQLVICLRDDGIGGAEQVPAEHKNGLNNMQLRAAKSGLRLNLSSPPGGGTTLTCRVGFSAAALRAPENGRDHDD